MGCSGRKGEAIRQCDLWLAPFKVLSLVVFAQSRAFSSTTIWLMVHECMWLEGICVQHSVASTAISRCLQVITIAVKNHCNSDVWWYYMWSLVMLDDVVGWLVKGSNKKGAMCLGVFSDAPRYNSWGLVKINPGIRHHWSISTYVFWLLLLANLDSSQPCKHGAYM